GEVPLAEGHHRGEDLAEVGVPAGPVGGALRVHALGGRTGKPILIDRGGGPGQWGPGGWSRIHESVSREGFLSAARPRVLFEAAPGPWGPSSSGVTVSLGAFDGPVAR